MENTLITLHYEYLPSMILYLRDRASSKFQPRSYPCIFVGYNSEHEGFQCFYSLTWKIFITRHVIFDEKVLPYTLSTMLTGENTITTYSEFLDSHLNKSIELTLDNESTPTSLVRCSYHMIVHKPHQITR